MSGLHMSFSPTLNPICHPHPPQPYPSPPLSLLLLFRGYSPLSAMAKLQSMSQPWSSAPLVHATVLLPACSLPPSPPRVRCCGEGRSSGYTCRDTLLLHSAHTSPWPHPRHCLHPPPPPRCRQPKSQACHCRRSSRRRRFESRAHHFLRSSHRHRSRAEPIKVHASLATGGPRAKTVVVRILPSSLSARSRAAAVRILPLAAVGRELSPPPSSSCLLPLSARESSPPPSASSPHRRRPGSRVAAM
jgi:hypothetical protein